MTTQTTLDKFSQQTCPHEIVFVDYFVGFGGFSCGAVAFSKRTLTDKRVHFVGVDNCPAALKQYAANIKRAGYSHTASCTTLSEESSFVPPVEGSSITFLHASFPCTLYSNARRVHGDETAERAKSKTAMRNFFAEVVRGGWSYWSFEEVPHKELLALLEEFRAAHPNDIDFAVLDFSAFNCPSDRRRIIAGPPAAIRILQQRPVERKSMRRALEERGIAVIGTHVKNSNSDSKLRDVEQAAFTLTASHPLVWANSDGKTVRVFSVDESAVMMAFPVSWEVPKGQRVGIRAIGNAIPPTFSERLVEAVFQANGLNVPAAAPAAAPVVAPVVADLETRLESLKRRLVAEVDAFARELKLQK